LLDFSTKKRNIWAPVPPGKICIANFGQTVTQQLRAMFNGKETSSDVA